MIWIALLSLVSGILCGMFVFGPEVVAFMDTLVSFALKLLVFSVGIDIGTNKTLFHQIKKQNVKILIIPLGIVVGSISGGMLAGYFLGLPMNISGAISSGFGWYSLSAIMVKDLAGANFGTIAFLTNVFREIIAFISVPLIAKWLNYYTAIAPAGATSMDTTLPIIAKSTNEETAIMAVLSGIICTALVPILVPLIFNII